MLVSGLEITFHLLLICLSLFPSSQTFSDRIVYVFVKMSGTDSEVEVADVAIVGGISSSKFMLFIMAIDFEMLTSGNYKGVLLVYLLACCCIAWAFPSAF